MDNGILRTCVRGLEYIKTWLWIISLVRRERYDVVHIDWFLLYKVDRYFLKELKKHCRKVVYTVHDALPHVDGQKSVHVLGEIYKQCDVCIVHGEGIKSELISLYDFPSERVYVQKHGAILGTIPAVDRNCISKIDRERLSRFAKKVLFLGIIFPNKGTDRLLRIWKDTFYDSDMALIVAGRKNAEYLTFDEYRKMTNTQDNVFLYDYRVSDELLNALIIESDLIVLPYRHASMSGVIFTAAQFSKPVLCTNVGALAEYLEDGVDSFVCENSTTVLREKLCLIEKMDKRVLCDMGIKLHDDITRKCDWLDIGNGIVNEVYLK